MTISLFFKVTEISGIEKNKTNKLLLARQDNFTFEKIQSEK